MVEGDVTEAPRNKTYHIVTMLRTISMGLSRRAAPFSELLEQLLHERGEINDQLPLTLSLAPGLTA